MTFREPETTEVSLDTSRGVPATLVSEEAPPQPPAIDDEAETTDAVPEGAFTPLPARGEDPVRLYLKEIGRVPLLTARQEVEIGRRIEIGQIALRRALAGIPMALGALLDVGDRLRRGDVPADDVIVLPEGGELDSGEIRSVQRSFGRMRRLEREIVRLQEALADRRRTAATRARVPRS